MAITTTCRNAWCHWWDVTEHRVWCWAYGSADNVLAKDIKDGWRIQVWHVFHRLTILMTPSNY